MGTPTSRHKKKMREMKKRKPKTETESKKGNRKTKPKKKPTEETKQCAAKAEQQYSPLHPSKLTALMRVWMFQSETLELNTPLCNLQKTKMLTPAPVARKKQGKPKKGKPKTEVQNVNQKRKPERKWNKKRTPEKGLRKRKPEKGIRTANQKGN